MRTVVLLRPSPAKDASRRSRRVVRSFCCDRHRPIGFDGTLSALGSRLALGVLLDRHRSWRAFARGPASQRSFVRQVCHGSLPRVARPAFSLRCPCVRRLPRSRHPFGVLAHRNQLLPDVPSSGYHRPRPGFLTLSAPSRFRVRSRACFIPDPPLGFSPFRAFSLCRAVMPLGTRFPLDVSPSSPAPSRSSGAWSRAPRSRSTRGFPREAKRRWAPPRIDRSLARARGRSRRSLAGSFPVLSRSLLRSGRPVAVRRTSAGSPSGLFSLQRARSSRPGVTPDRGRGPPGVRLSRARSRREGVGISRLPPAPLGLSRPRPESPRDQSRAPQGFSCLDGWTLLSRDAPALMRFSTLSLPSRGSVARPPLAAADGSLRSFRIAGPSASPRTPGVRRRAPAGPLRGGPSGLACAPRERTSR
jgi:hypothetical protein